MAESVLESESGSEMARSNVFIEMRTDRRSAKSFFIEEQLKALDSFIEQSRSIFKQTGDLFLNRYETFASQLTQSRGSDLQRQLSRTTKQFQAYCLLKKKLDYKKELISNFSTMVASKNVLRTFFKAWLNQKNKQIRRKRLFQKAQAYNQKRTLRVVLRAWNNVMMQETRAKIRNNVLRKTHTELEKTQKEYEKIIDEMERALRGKLLELKREEEEHKLLHDKYQMMWDRRRLEAEHK